ncbi:hypothetical protein FP568_21835 [Pandoraea pnomenusa]|uniref:Uncharacterized protein n=1 Tax=Pandoraea nosoerga TaxID=2508296 RepID=A0A5E4VUE4_9BURK|nr:MULTISPECIES: hypothetical protein [Pandoraea]MDM8359529.1 hypothetical protein [Pandoraea communis]QDX23591.1 hypothetical protein FP568_21835 [Pandoraea pnomenusa]VVE14555.1 hypothetical protein PNO31109_02806 [Pandoraea nosoerga]
MKRIEHGKCGAGWGARTAMRRAGLLSVIVTTFTLGGCAVTKNSQGNTVYGIDQASLFGTVVDTFKLADGSEGNLRRSNGQYSLKLERYMRVLPLQNAITARVVRNEVIGDRSVVVVETQERNCPFKYVLYAIQDSDVLGWTFGNCADRPRADLIDQGRALVFDFPGNGRLVRHTYTDSRLLQSAIPVPPGVDVRRKPFADASLKAIDDPADANRFIPAPPQAAGATANNNPAPARHAPARRQARNTGTTAPANNAPAPNTPTTVASSGRTVPGLPSAPSAGLTFGAEEVKPVRVDLRN